MAEELEVEELLADYPGIIEFHHVLTHLEAGSAECCLKVPASRPFRRALSGMGYKLIMGEVIYPGGYRQFLVHFEVWGNGFVNFARDAVPLKFPRWMLDELDVACEKVNAHMLEAPEPEQVDNPPHTVFQSLDEFLTWMLTN